jgi:rare lipoprotein A (peptidoglycan hydrolase)
MVLVPLASLAYVHESDPAATALSASGTSAMARAQRIEEFRPDGGRASRSQPANDREEPVATTSTAAPTTTTSKPKPTTTTAKPKPTTTTAKAVVKAAAVTTTTVKPTTTTVKPTTTTAKPAPTTTTTAPASTSNHQEGGASYHQYADASTCAHRTLPFGTVLTVTNLANGKKTTCVVNDRGPYVDGRIVDLSQERFAAIASISDGVIRVAIDW